MIITLSDKLTQVSIKDSLTWGDTEYIRSAMYEGIKVSMSGNADIGMKGITEMKYRLLEKAIIEIRVGDKTQKFSREWMNNLSVVDGDAIVECVDKLDKKK